MLSVIFGHAAFPNLLSASMSSRDNRDTGQIENVPGSSARFHGARSSGSRVSRRQGPDRDPESLTYKVNHRHQAFRRSFGRRGARFGQLLFETKKSWDLRMHRHCAVILQKKQRLPS